MSSVNFLVEDIKLKLKRVIEFFKKNNFFAVILIAGVLFNLLLLSKYNIYVGDDTYYSSYIYENHFAHIKEFSIDRKNEFFIAKILGFFYTYGYSFGVQLLEFLKIPYYRLNIFSAILFFASFIFFRKTAEEKISTNVVVTMSILFFTFEPFLVMSHAVRPDAPVFFVLALMLYVLIKYKSTFKWNLLLLLVLLIAVGTSAPVVPLFMGFCVSLLYIHGRKILPLLLLCSIFSGLVYLFANDLTNVSTVRAVYEGLHGATSGRTGYIISSLYGYFFKAKFVRHLIELPLIGIAICLFFKFHKFSRENRSLIIFFLVSFASYMALGWLNVYYLPFLFLILMVFLMRATDQFSWVKKWLSAITLGTMVLYTLIFLFFIRNDSWQRLMAIEEDLMNDIQGQVNVVAPGYLVHMNPEIFRSFVPLEMVQKQALATYDLIILDTAREDLASLMNNEFVLSKTYELGMLATQGIRSGNLYVYKRK